MWLCALVSNDMVAAKLRLKIISIPSAAYVALLVFLVNSVYMLRTGAADSTRVTLTMMRFRVFLPLNGVE